MVYLNRAPADNPTGDTESISRKLLQRSTGLYKFLASTSHTVVIEIDRLQDTVAIDHVYYTWSPPTSSGSTSDVLNDTPLASSHTASQITNLTEEQTLTRPKDVTADPTVALPIKHSRKVVSADPLLFTCFEETHDGKLPQLANDGYALLYQIDLPGEHFPHTGLTGPGHTKNDGYALMDKMGLTEEWLVELPKDTCRAVDLRTRGKDSSRIDMVLKDRV